MTQHIGIVACSAEGAALCYRTICVEGAAPRAARAPRSLDAHATRSRDYMELPRPRRLAGRRATLMLASADKLARARRRLPDLPRQHHPPGAAARRRALAAAVAAHRRGRRRRSGASAASDASASPARAGSSTSDVYPGQARGARTRVRAPGRRRARRDQPHHHGRAGVRRVQAGGRRLLPAASSADEGRRLRRRRARLHRDPADHDDANSPLPTLDSTRLLARRHCKERLRPDKRRSGGGSSPSQGHPVAEKVGWITPANACEGLAAQRLPHEVEPVLAEEHLLADEHRRSAEHAACDRLVGGRTQSALHSASPASADVNARIEAAGLPSLRDLRGLIEIERCTHIASKTACR